MGEVGQWKKCANLDRARSVGQLRQRLFGRRFPDPARPREGGAEAAALTGGGFGLDGTAVQLDEVLGDGEAEAGALHGLIGRAALEFVEDGLEVLRRDAGPGVFYGKGPRVVSAIGTGDGDAAGVPVFANGLSFG